jgi:hypothetical protein
MAQTRARAAGLSADGLRRLACWGKVRIVDLGWSWGRSLVSVSGWRLCRVSTCVFLVRVRGVRYEGLVFVVKVRLANSDVVRRLEHCLMF